MIGAKFGKYVTIKALGSGAMGHVYEAIEEPLGRRVALKVLDQSHASNPHLRARFQNEVRAASGISHPGAVSIYALDETPAGVPFLVMELLVGETLRERMRREGSLSWSVVLGIARQLASTLRQAHKNGVVHRDVKPANIMLTSDPEAPGSVRTKLLDFGIAKLPALEDAAITSVRTASGMVMGTPEYMSPEQCRDGATADGRADVYALATTLFHALTGQLPVGTVGLRADALLYAHLHHEPRLLRALCPDLPPEVSVLWQRMLAKDPAARPTMAEVVDALRAFPEQTATTELALRPGQTVRSYRVLRLLCVGPRGAFFDAVHLDSDAVHAIIKVPSGTQGKDEQAVAQLRTEARALMTQVDPGIVKILDFGHLLGGLPYVIMEHLPARTLRSECDFMAEQRQRHGAARLRLEQQAMAVRVVRQLAATLEVGAANAPSLALRPEGLLVVPSQAHHAEPLVKALDLGLGETLAGLPSAAAHKSAEEIERAQVQRLSDLLQELLVGAGKDGRRPALGSRPLQALVARMQDPRGERRPRLAEVIVALDRLQATTLLERRGGLSRVSAALGLLILALGCALAAARLLPRDAPPAAEVRAAAPRPVPAVAKTVETAEAQRLLSTPATAPAPPAPRPRHRSSSHPPRAGALRSSAPTPSSLALRLSVSAGGAVTWSAADHSGSCTAAACDTAPPPVGATVNLQAQPASGWYLEGWGDDAAACSEATACALTPGGASAPSVSARFERLVPLRLSQSGEGELAPQEPGVACGDARCYRPGQRVHIQARPRGAAVLRGWNQPAACQQQSLCEVTIPKADELRVAATFGVPQGVVKLDVVGCGCIEMSPKHADPFCVGSCQEAAHQGSEITLKVARGTDPEACHFAAWDPRGACPRADSEQCRLRVGAVQHVRAVFTATSRGGGPSLEGDPTRPRASTSNKHQRNRGD